MKCLWKNYYFILHSQLAKMVSKYFQEQEQKEQKAEEEEGKKLKKIASQIAKHVKEFWSNIEKVCKFYCLFCNKYADSLTNSDKQITITTFVLLLIEN